MPIEETLKQSDLMFKLLIDAAQKFGVVGAIALFSVLVFAGMCCFLIYKVVSSYESQMNTINEQNKEYQDYFLKNRRSSGHKYLGEERNKKDEQ